MSTFLLPQHKEGLLPYFLLFTSTLAILHSLACFFSSPSIALKQFSGSAAPPPHGLLARVYGVKNIYTGLIRLYAAYHISERAVYDLAIVTFLGAFGLYFLEVFVYKTSRVREIASTFVISGLGVGWMVLERWFYTF